MKIDPDCLIGISIGMRTNSSNAVLPKVMDLTGMILQALCLIGDLIL